jgi:hypothetical protein
MARPKRSKPEQTSAQWTAWSDLIEVLCRARDEVMSMRKDLRAAGYPAERQTEVLKLVFRQLQSESKQLRKEVASMQSKVDRRAY